MWENTHLLTDQSIRSNLELRKGSRMDLVFTRL